MFQAATFTSVQVFWCSNTSALLVLGGCTMQCVKCSQTSLAFDNKLYFNHISFTLVTCQNDCSDYFHYKLMGFFFYSLIVFSIKCQKAMKSTHHCTSICSARQCKLLLLSNLLSKNQRYSQNNDVKERRWQICTLEQLVPALMYFSLIGYFNRFFLIVKIDS